MKCKEYVQFVYTVVNIQDFIKMRIKQLEQLVHKDQLTSLQDSTEMVKMKCLTRRWSPVSITAPLLCLYLS